MKRLLKIIVAAVLLAWVVSLIDFKLLWQVVSKVNIPFLFLYIFLQIVAVLLSVKKWQVVASVRNISFSFFAGVKIYLLGMFLNNFFPSTIGGDVYRGHALGKISGQRGGAFYTVLFERLQGLWIVLLLVSIFPIFFWEYIKASLFLTVSVGIGVGIFLGSLLGYVLVRKKLLSAFVQYLPSSIHKIVSSLEEDAKKIGWHHGLGTAGLFIFFGPFLSNLVLFFAFGVNIPFLLAFFLLALAAGLSSVPLSFGNLGVKEGVYILLFTPLGISLEVAVGVVLVSRVVQIGISLLAVPQYLARQQSLLK